MRDAAELLARDVLAMTPTEARELVREDPKRWRAAFVEGTSTPLLDDPQARVRLHPTVGAAQDELRARKGSLEKNGYAVIRGSLGKNILVLSKDDETRVIGVDKRRRG